MKDLDKLALVKRWGYQCIVCGRGFTNLACLTKEHIIPRSKLIISDRDNIGPSHNRCNNLRGNDSIIAASRRVNELYQKHVDRHSENWAIQWLNKILPGYGKFSTLMISPEKLEASVRKARNRSKRKNRKQKRLRKKPEIGGNNEFETNSNPG